MGSLGSCSVSLSLPALELVLLAAFVVVDVDDGAREGVEGDCDCA